MLIRLYLFNSLTLFLKNLLLRSKSDFTMRVANHQAWAHISTLSGWSVYKLYMVFKNTHSATGQFTFYTELHQPQTIVVYPRDLYFFFLPQHCCSKQYCSYPAHPLLWLWRRSVGRSPYETAASHLPLTSHHKITLMYSYKGMNAKGFKLRKWYSTRIEKEENSTISYIDAAWHVPGLQTCSWKIFRPGVSW